MNKLTHPELIEHLKDFDLISLIYIVIEAKSGKHVDLLTDVPKEDLEPVLSGLNRLILHSKLNSSSV